MSPLSRNKFLLFQILECACNPQLSNFSTTLTDFQEDYFQVNLWIQWTTMLQRTNLQQTIYVVAVEISATSRFTTNILYIHIYIWCTAMPAHVPPLNSRQVKNFQSYWLPGLATVDQRELLDKYLQINLRVLPFCIDGVLIFLS